MRITKLFAILIVLCGALTARAQVGDGVTDDTLNIQHRLDKLAEGGTLQLSSGKTYRITDNLHINKRLTFRSTIAGKTATLLYDHGPRPFNKVHLDISATTGPERWWNEKIAAGIRPAATQPASGQHYVVGYGSDPFDVNAERFVGFSDAGGLPAAPDDVQGDHWYAPVVSSPDGTLIQDIDFQQTEGTIIDYAIGISRGRAIAVRNITGNFYIAVAIMDSEGVVVDGLRGSTIYFPPHTASNRAVTGSQCRGVSINNVDVSASDRQATIMFESWASGIIVQNLRVRLRGEAQPAGQWPIGPVFFSNGGCSSMAVLNARIDTDKTLGLYLWDCGGEPNQEPPRFGTILHTGVLFAVGNVPITKLVKAPVETP